MRKIHFFCTLLGFLDKILTNFSYLCIAMSSGSFQFKQFEVRHDRSSMKVGTDGVLLGAWAGNSKVITINNQLSILDIGTGCGLIAMMLAQRFPEANITGIDIDLPSVEQAHENVLHSPFHNRIEILHQDIKTYTPLISFSLIVSNPPFYEEDTIGHCDSRNNARHTTSLTFEQLIEGVNRLLCEDGEFDVIIPYSTAERFIGIAAMNDLYLVHRCDVRGNDSRPNKRCLLAFTHQPSDLAHQTTYTSLTLYDPQGHRSLAYHQLTKEFYL